MKLLNKFIIILSSVLILSLGYAKAETLEDIAGELNDLKESISNLDTSEVKEAAVFDEALNEITKAVDFVNEKVNAGDLDTALSALNYADAAATDIAKSTIPKEFETEVVKKGEELTEEQTAQVNEITGDLNSSKEKKTIKLVEDMLDINVKGLNTVEISGKLKDLGVATVALKQEHVDKLKNELALLETPNQVETLATPNTDMALQSTEDTELIEKYNQDIENVSIQINQVQTKTDNTIQTINQLNSELSTINTNEAQIQSQISGLNGQINQVQTQSANLYSKINNLGTELDTSYKNINDINQKVASFNNQLEENSNLTNTKQSELSKFKSSLSELGNQVKNLSTERQNLTNKYNAELAKQAKLNISPADLAKSQNLSEQINKEVTNISTKIDQIGTQSSDLAVEINTLNLEIEKNTLASNELNQQIVSFNGQLQDNYNLVNSKQLELNNLQTSLPELDNKIKNLNSQTQTLTDKYNAELAKQAQGNISAEDLAKNQKLSDQFKANINNVATKINQIESQSSGLSAKINGLTNEINKNSLASNDLNQQVVSLSSELQQASNLISSKQSELNGLQSSFTEIDSRLNQLNGEIKATERERDFAQVLFERNINNEIEHFEVYGNVLGDDANEVKFALKEVDVLLDPDPRNQRAFEFEMYGTYAGLSEETINKGIKASLNSDWDTQKSVMEEIYTGLSNNPNWSINVPSNAELNVMIAEEQAIDDITWIAYQGERIQTEVDYIINSKVEEFNKNNELAKFSADVFKNHSERMFHKGSYSGWSGSITDEYKQVFENEVNSLLNDQNKRIFDENLVKIERYNAAKAAGKYDTWSQAAWDDYRVFSTAESVNSNLITTVGEQAKLNLINKIEEVDKVIENIKTEEIAKAPGYNYADSINNIMKKIPTFDLGDQTRVSQVLNPVNASWGYVETSLVSNKAAALKAALYDQNTFNAYKAAVNGVKELGKPPVNEYMSGPYWEMSHVKLAAIVKSKKYDYVDDYAYQTAYYESCPTSNCEYKLNLTTKQKSYFKEEYSRLFPNQELIAVENKITLLNDQINKIEDSATTSPDQIKELKNELTSAEKSKKQIETQILNLDQQINKNETEINNGKKTLADLEQKMSPLNSELESLKTEKTNLSVKLDEQIAKVTKDLEAKAKIDSDVATLKGQYEKEMLNLTTKISAYQSESESTLKSIETMNGELVATKAVGDGLQNQISTLNEQINQNLLTINTKQASLNTLQQQLAPLNIQLESLKSEKTDFTAKLDVQIANIAEAIETKGRISTEEAALKEQYEAEINQLTVKISSIESQTDSSFQAINQLNSELSTINTTEAQIQIQISGLNDQINQVKTQTDNTIQTINQLNSELSTINASEAQIQIQISGLNDQIEQSQNTINIKKTSLNDFEQQLAKFNTELQSLNNNKKDLVTKVELTMKNLAQSMQSGNVITEVATNTESISEAKDVIKSVDTTPVEGGKLVRYRLNPDGSTPNYIETGGMFPRNNTGDLNPGQSRGGTDNDFIGVTKLGSSELGLGELKSEKEVETYLDSYTKDWPGMGRKQELFNQKAAATMLWNKKASYTGAVKELSKSVVASQELSSSVEATKLISETTADSKQLSQSVSRQFATSVASENKVVMYTLTKGGTIPSFVENGGRFAQPNFNNTRSSDYNMIGVAVAGSTEGVTGKIGGISREFNSASELKQYMISNGATAKYAESESKHIFGMAACGGCDSPTLSDIAVGASTGLSSSVSQDVSTSVVSQAVSQSVSQVVAASVSRQVTATVSRQVAASVARENKVVMYTLTKGGRIPGFVENGGRFVQPNFNDTAHSDYNMIGVAVAGSTEGVTGEIGGISREFNSVSELKEYMLSNGADAKYAESESLHIFAMAACGGCDSPSINDLNSVIAESTSQDVSASVSQDVSASVSQDVSASVSQDVSASVSQEVSASVSQEVAESVSQEVAESVSQEVAESVSQEVAAAVAEEVAASVAEEVAASVAQEVAQEVAKEVVAEVAKEVAAEAVEGSRLVMYTLTQGGSIPDFVEDGGYGVFENFNETAHSDYDMIGVAVKDSTEGITGEIGGISREFTSQAEVKEYLESKGETPEYADQLSKNLWEKAQRGGD